VNKRAYIPLSHIKIAMEQLRSNRYSPCPTARTVLERWQSLSPLVTVQQTLTTVKETPYTLGHRLLSLLPLRKFWAAQNIAKYFVPSPYRSRNATTTFVRWEQGLTDDYGNVIFRISWSHIYRRSQRTRYGFVPASLVHVATRSGQLPSRIITVIIRSSPMSYMYI